MQFRGSGDRDEFLFVFAERPEGAFRLGLAHPVVGLDARLTVLTAGVRPLNHAALERERN
jgi:hypothetical protein